MKRLLTSLIKGEPTRTLPMRMKLIHFECRQRWNNKVYLENRSSWGHYCKHQIQNIASAVVDEEVDQEKLL